jgi:GNAT superfamily N-acetyltransferase
MRVVDVREARVPDDLASVQQLWLEYLTWGNDEMQSRYGLHPHDPAEAVAQDLAAIDKFLPPHGRLMLAFVDGQACGVGCLKRLDDETAEVKRMYVDPKLRKVGAGRAIVQALITAARATGYRRVRLDSPKFLEPAHTLYRSVGFKDIEAYPEVELPEAFRQYLVFMELVLS